MDYENFDLDNQGFPIALIAYDSDKKNPYGTVVRINPNDNSYEIIGGIPGVLGYSENTLYWGTEIFVTPNNDVYISDSIAYITRN